MVEEQQSNMASEESAAPPQEPKKPGGGRNLTRFSRVAVVTAGIVLALGTAAAYAGVQPFATWKDVVQQRLAPFDDVGISIPSNVYPRTRQFSGTYITSVPVLEYEQTLTFKGDTVTVVDAFAGTFVYHYTATMESETEGVLELEDAETGNVSQIPLEYVPDADCLILYQQGLEQEGVTFCR